MNFIGGVSVVGLVIVLQEKRKRDFALLRRFVGLKVRLSAQLLCCGLSRRTGKSRVVQNRGIIGGVFKAICKMHAFAIRLNEKMRCAAHAVSGNRRPVDTSHLHRLNVAAREQKRSGLVTSIVSGPNPKKFLQFN
jgi:hypothetical protein